MNPEQSEHEKASNGASRAVDFASPLFDPRRALHDLDLQPPDITVEPLPDLQACIAFLPQDSLPHTMSQVGDDLVTFADNENEKEMQGLVQHVGTSNSSFSLDFFSPDFDAFEALYTKDLVPPNPRVRPLDNLSSCRRILPEEVPESIVNIPLKPPRSADSILAQERAKAHKSVLLLKAAERERQVKVFDKITEKLKQGPLGLLADCYYNHIRVKVWTRHSRGVRGSLTGYLVAFDKHINMVLQDIDEQYSVRRWVSRLVHCRGKGAKAWINTGNQGDCEDSTCEKDLTVVADEITERLKELRLFPKLEHRQRHLKQVFLRGDSVVMVQKLS